MILKGKRIVDITSPIRQGMPVYPGDPEPVIRQIYSIEKDNFALSAINMGSHTGTHVDAPSHVIENGSTVDMLLPESFMGSAILLDMSCIDSPISAEHMEKAWKKIGPGEGTEVLLLKTGAINPLKGTDEFCLSEDITSWIHDKALKVLGVDALSIENENGLPLHRSLLSQGINIIECLNLEHVEEGHYTLICLPLKITGCDGAPARAILIEE
ncbi:cyclase family protein [uncultured Methanomethylovorans sp.]|uniref:cyclase family protein n=1 Tax=uncultured Methanomethylovorans sp. TaxID=183759 RepID=UPI002AA6E197|nr:cyclase family protein [uncultured Methanomethylovorans sp.]